MSQINPHNHSTVQSSDGDIPGSRESQGPGRAVLTLRSGEVEAGISVGKTAAQRISHSTLLGPQEGREKKIWRRYKREIVEMHVGDWERRVEGCEHLLS